MFNIEFVEPKSLMSNLSNLKVSVKTDLSAKPFKPVHQFIDKTTTTQQMQQVSNIIVQLWSSCPWKTEWGKGRTLDNLVPPQNYRWQNRKEYKGKTNAAQSALARLLWLLYRPGTTHRPHLYPTHGEWGWLEGAPGQYQPAPLPLDSTLTH